MKYFFLTIFFLFAFSNCTNSPAEDINIKFTSKEAFDSDYLKRNENKIAELITYKKQKNRIQLIVEKYVTGGPKYFGKAKIKKDTLYLYYWINMDPMDISAVIIPKKFIYEIKDVPYKHVKFEYLGNEFKSKDE